MKKTKEYLKLFRVKHYIKNLLIFIPIFFGGEIFDLDKLLKVFLGGICFCLVSSAVYILNDYRDIEKDRNHPMKKNRPLASGKISTTQAVWMFVLCIVAALGISVLLKSIAGTVCLMLYFVEGIVVGLIEGSVGLVGLVVGSVGLVVGSS